MQIDREPLIFQQSLQSVLASWRTRNPWADDIPFERFPERYRAEIELAAHLNLNR